MKKSPNNNSGEGKGHGRSAPRRRLPVHAELSINDLIAANDSHPLSATAPELRAASRLRLIAGILARLARGSLGTER